ncbi:MAG: glycosyltransferase family A protein [Candidatus Saccharimonadales bacterium]
MKTANPKISIVIPAYNEADFLPRCLKSLQAQENAPPHEVIVVDNASTDNTAVIARQFGARVVRETEQGVVHARQAGLEAAKGEIIVSTDADSFFRPDWLEFIGIFFDSHPGASGLAGHYYFYKAPIWAKIMPPMGALGVWLLSLLAHRPIYVSAANLSFRKSAFSGYDTRFYQGADERGVRNELVQNGRLYVTLKNPVFTSSRRVNQGFLHSMVMTIGYYYSYGVWETKKKGYSKIGPPPAIRTEDKMAHLPILVTQWVVAGVTAVVLVEIIRHHLWRLPF